MTADPAVGRTPRTDAEHKTFRGGELDAYAAMRDLARSLELELSAKAAECERLEKDADEDVRAFHALGNTLKERAEKAERNAAIYKRDCEAAEKVCSELQSKLDAIRTALQDKQP